MGRHRTAEEKVRLGEQARAMRAAGKSRREIQTALHLGDELVSELLRGVPVPTSLRRRKAKDDLRARARALREAGWTYPQIAKELGVSKSSCSLWLRDMVHPLGSLEGQERRTAAIRASAARTQELRQAEREAFWRQIRDAFGSPSDRDLLVALAVSYWCEGSKSKPWERREMVRWMNSDLTLVRLFLAGVRLLGITDGQIRLRVQIHESADEAAARQWWADQLGWSVDAFQRSTIKRHAPKTVRKNVGADYHGCLTVQVLQSRLLYQLLDGLMQAVAVCSPAMSGNMD